MGGRFFFGIPEWAAKAVGVESEAVQSVRLEFGCKDFARAHVMLVPTAEALEKLAEHLDDAGALVVDSTGNVREIVMGTTE